MNEYLPYIIIAIIILCLILAWIGAKTKNDDWKKYINDKLQKLSIVHSTNDMQSLSAKFIELDKLLDYSLKMKYFKGNTLGEKLKNAKKFYEPKLYNQIWEAHKIRNQLVHEVDFKLETKSASAYIQVYVSAIHQLIK